MARSGTNLPPLRRVDSDLAPGDVSKSRGLDRSKLALTAIRSGDDPAFPDAYRTLWDEFGAKGELEDGRVLARRLCRDDTPSEDGWRLRYEMLAVSDGKPDLAAMRDHSVIIPPAWDRHGAPPVVVHLSHVLVARRWRRRGLAGWMRALPLQLARQCCPGNPLGEGGEGTFILVSEMESAAVDLPARTLRLAAYERAGFLAVDPERVAYFQPDFGSPEQIETQGGPRPIPLTLVIRRVGREQEKVVDGSEVRLLVSALYRVYAGGCRAEDILALTKQMEANYPRPGESVRLVRPRFSRP